MNKSRKCTELAIIIMSILSRIWISLKVTQISQITQIRAHSVGKGYKYYDMAPIVEKVLSLDIV